MKRLTDEARLTLIMGRDQVSLPGKAVREAQDALDQDHFQAREDVRRLAARLRERLGGRCCEALRAQCVACATDEALLAEVES